MKDRNNNHIILENGKVLYLKNFSSYFPFTFVRIHPIHLDVCEFVASNFFTYKTKSLEWKVLVNFLSQRSEKTKTITALILYSKRYKISEINVDFINSNFLRFFDYPIKVKNKTIYEIYWLDKNQQINSIIKYFPNTLFRLLRSKSVVNVNSVIRAWVDVDEELHKNQFSSSLIFIYPFGINLLRSIKFIIHCFNSYKNVSLMGIPYSFKKMLKIFVFNSYQKDYNIIDFEIDGILNHKKEFENFKYIYTSDEFVPAIICLYNNIKSKTINNTHGIGFYNPYVQYDEMILFNIPQRDYYFRRNNEVKYFIKGEKENNVFRNKFETLLVFIDQGNLKSYNLYFEDNLQKFVISVMNNVAKVNNINVAVKFHPNRNNKTKKAFLKKFNNFFEIKKFDLKSDKKYIFINLYSTAYYDYRKYGEFYFISDVFFNPCLFFGKEIQTLSKDSLSHFINTLISK